MLQEYGYGESADILKYPSLVKQNRKINSHHESGDFLVCEKCKSNSFLIHLDPFYVLCEKCKHIIRAEKVVALASANFDADAEDIHGAYVDLGEGSSLQYNHENSKIVSISSCDSHIAALFEDGRVQILKGNGKSTWETLSWTNIVAISANDDYTAGLQENGTIVLSGTNKYNRFDFMDGDLTSGSNICGVFAGEKRTVGLRTDGSAFSSIFYSIFDPIGYLLSYWRNIIKIGIGRDFVLGLSRDGKCEFAEERNCHVFNYNKKNMWTYIKDIAVSSYGAVGLRYNGDFVCSNNYSLKKHPSIALESISAAHTHIAGLSKDGRVVLFENDGISVNTLPWHNIIQVSCSSVDTYGLTRDGKILQYGFNTNYQTKVIHDA